MKSTVTFNLSITLKELRNQKIASQLYIKQEIHVVIPTKNKATLRFLQHGCGC